MTNIKVIMRETIVDGSEVVFRSPLDYHNISGMHIVYPDVEGNDTSKDFVFVDAHRNDVTQLSDLFAQDSIVKVILDCTNGLAFIQNADTNAYLEEKFNALLTVTEYNNQKGVAGGIATLDSDGKVVQPPATHTHTVEDIGADAAGTASNLVTGHNVATDSHNDIRELISGLNTRLNTLANSTDEDLDQMAELVTYIKNNKDLIDGITTNKVNVSDIINNLETNVENKPLSAAQGVALKALIDAITVPTKVSELTNDSGYLTSFTETDPTVPAWAKAETKPTYTYSEVGADKAGSATSALSDSKSYTDSEIAQVKSILSTKVDSYAIEVWNNVEGVHGLKFLTVDYSTCDSENGVAIKLGMFSGHGNGSSYRFFQEATINVTHLGAISVDNLKYYDTDASSQYYPTYNNRRYGDIFWVHNVDNKTVDFYCIIGQFARLKMTPYTRVTWSSGGTITQHTTAQRYSDGEKVWANNTMNAVKSDIPVPDATLTKPNVPADAKAVGDIVNNLSKIFIGTQAEYDIVNAQDDIPVGSLVIIVDEGTDLSSYTATLGFAVLGQMILGQN